MAKTKQTTAAKSKSSLLNSRRAAKRRHFLDAISQGASVNAACRFAKISTGTQLNWRKTDPDFAAEFKIAFDDGTDQLESTAFARAVRGVRKPVYFQGKQALRWNEEKQEYEGAFTTEYSDTLLIFMLKSRDPARFDDRVRAEKIFRRWRKKDAADGTDAGAVAAADVVELLARLASDKAATIRKVEPVH